jgi:hypothetical protein
MTLIKGVIDATCFSCVTCSSKKISELQSHLSFSRLPELSSTASGSPGEYSLPASGIYFIMLNLPGSAVSNGQRRKISRVSEH